MRLQQMQLMERKKDIDDENVISREVEIKDEQEERLIETPL